MVRGAMIPLALSVPLKPGSESVTQTGIRPLPSLAKCKLNYRRKRPTYGLHIYLAS